MASRNALVTLSLALAVLAVVIGSIGVWLIGVAVVELDPSDTDNYDTAQDASDPEQRRELRSQRGDTMTWGWASITGGGLLGVAALATGLLAPPRGRIDESLRSTTNKS